jgi:hypothetical protein
MVAGQGRKEGNQAVGELFAEKPGFVEGIA